MGTHLIDHSDQSDSSFWVKYLCGQYWPKGGSIVQGWGKHGRVGETRGGGGGGEGWESNNGIYPDGSEH